MNRLKRITAAAAAVAVSLSMMSFASATASASAVASGSSSKTESARFDEFLASLPAALTSSDDLSIHLLFNNPQAFGFQQVAPEHSFTSISDLQKAGTSEYDALLGTLKGFDYKKLSESQKVSYLTIEDYLELNKALASYPYLNNDYLSAACSLPSALILFTFQSKEDITDYFHLLQTARETFVKYAQNEQERQDKGVGLPAVTVQSAIDQCNQFINGSTDYLLQFFDEQIDAATFLTAAEKSAFKRQNKSLIENDLVNAYKTLKQELSKIKVKSPDGGLAARPQGQEYYQKLVQAEVGTLDNIEAIRQMLTDGMESYEEKMRQILNDPQKKLLLDEDGNLLTTDKATAEGLISALYEGSKADFPSIGMPKYTLKQVPGPVSASFEEAAFRNPRVDALPSDSQLVLLNGGFDQSDLNVIAHETIPGHMYQYNFTEMLDLPAIRQLIGFEGAAEGWAIYAAGYAADYVPEQYHASAQYAYYDTMRSYCFTALLDIGIHYDGWTRERALQFFQENFSEDITLDYANIWYDVCLQNPGSYLPYAAGPLYFEQLRDGAQAALGSDFDPVQFHQELLKAGNTTFPIYQRQVDQYVADTLESRKAA